MYDIESEAWFHSVYGHKAVEGRLDIGVIFTPWTGRDKPVLHQNSAVVGARIFNENTREEIRHLFQRTFATPPKPTPTWKVR